MNKSLAVVGSVIVCILIGVGVGLNVLAVLSLASSSSTAETQEKVVEVIKPETNEGTLYDAYRGFYDEINKTRAKYGKPELEVYGELEKTASLKLVTMVSQNCWAHDCGVGFYPLADTVERSHFGENLAYGYDTIEELIQAWLDSPTHKANLLGDYKYQGVSILCGVRYQDMTSACIWVHHFSN